MLLQDQPHPLLTRKDFLSELKTKFANPQKVILTLHRRPDGDSVGSNLALASVLKELGNEVRIVSTDKVPGFLSFIPNSDQIEYTPDYLGINWSDYDTYWALDMSAPDMLGALPNFPESLEVIVIDHHKTNEGWGNKNFVMPEEVSCASVLFGLLKDLNMKLTSDSAFALLVGMATDTGFFNYISNGKPLKDAGELIDTYNLPYEELIYNIKRQLQVENIVFLGQQLSNLKVDYEHKMAYIAIPNASWLADPKISEGTHLLQGYIQSVEGTNFGVIITEEKKGFFKMSFRSRDRKYDVSAIAMKFGGGGHKGAAGAMTQADTMEEVIHLICKHVEELG